jgi:Ca-activated chloride channel family protein
MPETLNLFHFAQPLWLWALLAPLVVALWLILTASTSDNARIRRYADAHLLPHLLSSHEFGTPAKWRRFALWSGLWTLAVLALAGPRWSYTDVQQYRPANSLVVVLDISRSMLASDVRPNRLARARQEVEDLLSSAQGVRVGLVAFASVSHVISPVTEDGRSIRAALPALSTDLVRLQGSRLSSALERAEQLLISQPQEGSRSILLISDGDFVEQGLEQRIANLADQGIHLHVLGIGTRAGDTVPGPGGRPLTDRTGQPVRSRLNEPLLKGLAEAGRGIYQTADYRDSDIRRVLAQVEDRSSLRAAGEARTRVWNEEFYWLVAGMLILLVPQFRRIWRRTARLSAEASHGH